MQNKYLNVGENILLTLWIGGMWVIGYMVAPILFTYIDDRSLAADVAGHTFRAMAVIGLISASLLLFNQFIQFKSACLRQWRCIVLLVMLLLTIVGTFVLHPMVVELRGIPEQAASLKLVHAAAQGVFMLNSVLGLLLVMLGLRPAD